MVTRILLDPRRDLPDGTTQSNPVIVTATPTGISEAGQVVILPTSLSFTIATSADLLQLPASAASWKWRLTVRDAVTNVLLQQRTVLVPDQASITYADLPDVDPTSLGDTVSHARNWDATFAQMLTLIQQAVNAGLDDVNTWSANTAYTAGTVLLNPSEQFVQAPADVPARSTYTAGDWTILTLNLAGVQALIAAQAAADAATYSTLAQLAASPDLLAVGAITRSGTGAATGFAVVWPDGAIGTFIGTESTTTPGAIDAYTITHVKAGTTITYTQPTLTRNASGAVTNRPAITAA